MEWINVKDSLPDEKFDKSCLLIAYANSSNEIIGWDKSVFSRDLDYLKRNCSNNFLNFAKNEESKYFLYAYEKGFTITHWMKIDLPK